MDTGKVHALRNKLQRQIHAVNPDILFDYPLQRYADLVKRYPKLVDYAYVSREVRQFCEDVLMNSNGYVLELYNKCLLLELIETAVSELDCLRVPDGVKDLYLLNFERITSEIENCDNPSGFYMFPGDRFLKELGVCNLKLIPAGAQKLDLCPLPMRFLFNGGRDQLLSGLKYVLFDLKGSFPLYRMQTDFHDPHLMAELTPRGWRDSYLRAAEMLRMNPEVKGIFGSTWFTGPRLEKVSPGHFYVQDLVGRNGGKIFSLGPCAAGIGYADASSSGRPRPHERVRSSPQGYLGIWARGPLIKWAEGRGRGPGPG